MRTVLYGTEGTIIVDNTSNTLYLFKNDLKGDKDFLNEKTKGLEIKIPVQISNHITLTMKLMNFAVVLPKAENLF